MTILPANGRIGIGDPLSGASAQAMVNVDLTGQAELPGHRCHHDSGSEQQGRLEPQRSLIVNAFRRAGVFREHFTHNDDTNRLLAADCFWDFREGCRRQPQSMEVFWRRG